MQNTYDDEDKRRHLRISEPSPWVARFAPLITPGCTVLDVAGGGGRHARLFLDNGCEIVAIDRDTTHLQDLSGDGRATVIEADLEADASIFADGGALKWRSFGGIVVVNYLHRPLMEDLVAALAPGGVLIYETFARGNEAFTRPRNPDHLLKSGELLALVSGRLQIIAYEHGRVDTADIPGVKQRLCAVNDLGAGDRDEGDPPTHAVMPENGG